MLVWSKSGRLVFWSVAAMLIGGVYAVPLAIIVMASFAGQWDGVLPSHATLEHYAGVLRGASGLQLRASVTTGIVASAVALVIGTWAALALRSVAPLPRRCLDLIFFIPSAVPSVSIGLGLLVAFSHPPLLLNGTTAIVFVAHLVLVSAFTYGNVSAALAGLSPDYEQVAESLGARPRYRLQHVTLPLIMPYLVAALSLSFALSMGELGATVMIYPPGWVTLPVSIFALTDRGDVFEGAALTVILVVTTLAVLVALARIPTPVAPPRAQR